MRLHWDSGNALAEEYLHRVLKAGVKILAHEINRSAASVFVLIEPFMAAYGDVGIGPFKLRSGAPQLLAACLEEGGEVRVLGGVELLGGEGDICRDINSSLRSADFWCIILLLRTEGADCMSQGIEPNYSAQFDAVVKIIEAARESAFRKVNEELIRMYWHVGEYVSNAMQTVGYGDAFMQRLADFFAVEYPEIKGFNRRGLYRMKQFYETYAGNEIVSSLVTQLSWTNHLKILSGCKSMEERLFYMKLSINERYSSRELERQIDSAYFERYMLSQNAPQAALTQAHDKTGNIFIDNYVLEFLDVPEPMAEHDLRNSIIRNLKDFILEIGKDFTFVGSEYRVQVGNHDYFIDLLFFHRGLSCLVAFELKIGEFKPEYISKMNLYLEALDREIKKEAENPSVGVILCAAKDDEVVEFALSRSLSPTMVSDYTLKLIDKALLQKKLKEYLALSETGEI
jgi:predicted nuclease of restriction endonuclease-like (RecB) superfamily